MNRYLTGLLGILLALSLASPAWALTLDEARASGRVGETLSGYLAARSQDAETLALVARVNQGRAQTTRLWRRAMASVVRVWRVWPVRSWSHAPRVGSTSKGSMDCGCVSPKP